MNPCVIFVYGILVLVHFWNGSLVCAHSCGLTQDIQSLFDRNSTQTIHISESQEGINESGFSFQTTSSTRQSMRFYVDYTNLSDPSRYCSTAGQTIDSFTGGTHTCTASDILTPAIRMKINSVLVPQAVDYIQRALKVNRVTTSIVLESDICFDAITVPAALTTTGITGFDYVLFVGANPVASQNVLAYATPCAYIDNTTGRPVVGLVNFNPAAQDGSQPEKSEVRTAIHEIMHALGFTSQYMATRFPAPYSNPLQSVILRGKATNIIVTPNIVAKAREFFNCNSITGVELEDAGGQGTAGSHWDKRTMLNDIMTGVTVPGELDLAVSPITLAYFEDTGNYDVDYNQASPRYMFDQNFSLGCGFINDRCNLASGGSGSVFCFNTDRGCTRTRSAIGACNLVTYSDDLPTEFQYLSNPRQGGSLGATDYCPFVMGFSNLVCSNENLTPGISGNGFYFGTDSRCFQTTGSDGSTTLGIRTAVATSIFSGGLRCLRGRCVDDVLQIQPGDSTDWFICPTDGGSIPIEGYNGNVICPPAAEMCSFFPRSFTTTSPSAPTSVPTSAPTSEPTSLPTSAPTSLPTSAPTSEPTSSPASAPGSSLPSNSPRDGTSSSVRYLPTISAAVLIIFCFA